MRTETTQIFAFDELSDEAKEKAIENIRNDYYNENEFAEWAIDDCYLLEPPQKELTELFGDDFYQKLNKGEKYLDSTLLKNNRKIFFSLGRDRYIDISNAMEVKSEYYFLLWSGIPKGMHEKVYFTIGKDTINFEENDCEYTFTDKEKVIIDSATSKFEDHCEEILNRIEADIDYRFTDEAIIEDIEANEWEFLKDGTQY